VSFFDLRLLIIPLAHSSEKKNKMKKTNTPSNTPNPKKKLTNKQENIKKNEKI
jgi:hypothetical protein